MKAETELTLCAGFILGIVMLVFTLVFSNMRTEWSKDKSAPHTKRNIRHWRELKERFQKEYSEDKQVFTK